MEPFIGTITMFGGNFAPVGWALCDGQLLAVSQYDALFSILGTTYGGDGRTTFGLPDLRGRAPMHKGNGPGLSNRNIGQKGGTFTNTLITANLPSHSHPATAKLGFRNEAGDETSPVGGSLALSPDNIQIYSADAPTPNLNMNNNTLSIQTGNTGGSQSVNNLQPFQCVNFIIALVGTYPSRN